MTEKNETNENVPVAVGNKYICINSLLQLEQLIASLQTATAVAVDTKSSSKTSLKADLIGVSLCAKEGEAYYIPVGHDDKSRNLPKKEALEVLSKLLVNENVKKIGHNIKYGLQVLHRSGLDIKPISFDTMLADYVLRQSKTHELKELAHSCFDCRIKPISDLIGLGKKQKSFASVDIDVAAPYAAEDADCVYHLWKFQSHLIDFFKLHKLYYDIEVPLVEVLTSMEEEGINVNASLLVKMSDELGQRLKALTHSIYTEVGREFNIDSTLQLSEVLFEDLKLPTKGETAGGKRYSTSEEVLKELSAVHVVPRWILGYRQLKKLKNTYVDVIPRLINAETGRLHTSFNQAIVVSGRLSSSNPDLQNIPITSNLGQQVRKAFVPRNEDFRLLDADYSQIELRVLAHFSEDNTLLEAFKNGEDIHKRTAADLYRIDASSVTDEMRQVAKTVNFSIIYGIGLNVLSQRTGLGKAEAKKFIEDYYAAYPGVKKYKDYVLKNAQQRRLVTTLFNRIRFLNDINALNYKDRSYAERIAMNTPIQGTAADIIKIAMIDIYKQIKGMKSKMILQIHDELVFDVHNDEIDELSKIVKNSMESVVNLKVPLVANIGIGNNWLDVKMIDEQ